jgi:preprotein translocase subunit SecD
MKSIVYILIAIFTASILYSAIPPTVAQSTQNITLTTVTQQITASQLESAVEVLTKRLEDFGIKTPSVKSDSEAGEIQIAIDQKLSNQEIRYLLLSKGQLDFHETINRKDVIEVFSANDELSKILDLQEGANSHGDYSSIIGFCMPQNMEKASEIVQEISKQNGMNVKFAWSSVSYPGGKYVLHLLSQKAAIDKKSIRNTKVISDQQDYSSELFITFNKKGTKLWSEISKNNIGKNIAIVLDNYVLSSPKVISQINGGKAVISGNYTKRELKLFSALANGQNLPIELIIKKLR